MKDKQLHIFVLIALVLIIPAYFINLGVIPVIEDESIRGLVAFEMTQNGDYVTPTLGGEIYLNKPPLYNWLIVLMFKITGNYSEEVLRIPVILSIFLFSATICFFIRKEYGLRMAILNALIFLTYGRILFYESLHGLIDITFSWFTYIMFMSAWFLIKKEKYLILFLLVYTISAVSYLMKGLPSVLFVVVTLLVLFIYHRKFRMLFNWRHIAGIVLFVGILALYYGLYFTRNHVEPGEVFDTLLGETTRRTVIRFGFFKTVLHLFTFPVEMCYHFLPWSLLLILLFRKGAIRKIRSQPLLRYSAWIFMVNIIPYWTSPEAFPRYIIMLMPVLFLILTWLYMEYKKENSVFSRVIEIIFGMGLILLIPVSVLPLFYPATQSLQYILPVLISFVIIFTTLSLIYLRSDGTRILWLVIALLVLRIGFNLTVVASRKNTSVELVSKQDAIELGEKTRDVLLFNYWNTDFEPDSYYGRKLARYEYLYYLSTSRGGIIRTETEKIPGALYIAKKDHIKNEDVIILRKIQPAGHQNPMFLVKFHE